MIKCGSCGHDVDYNGGICLICGSPLHPTEKELEAVRAALVGGLFRKNPAKITAARELLAAFGDTESQREYGKFLERTDTSLRNLDLAMHYFRLAAEKNDPPAAYYYSRLLTRGDKTVGDFWLRYSGILGYTQAYPEIAEYYSATGDEATASYYFSLAAAASDTPSMVTMAKRYAEGVGVPRSEPYAKWYLDKFLIPPVSAGRLAWSLRNIVAVMPKELCHPDKIGELTELLDIAKELGLHTAYFRLATLLSDIGNSEYQTLLGILTAEGIGTEKNPSEALSVLNTAVMNGSVNAMMYLAENYASGEGFLGYDIQRALEYFARAANSGHSKALLRLGDIYKQGLHSDCGMPDFSAAEKYYRQGSGLGDEECTERLLDIENRRSLHFSRGTEIMSRSSVTRKEAQTAFKSLYLALMYGEARAKRPLAKCYAWGFGTEENRKEAFRLFREAAEGGDKEALFPLGICYAKGFGTAFSYRHAIKYLSEARASGFSEAAGEISLLKTRRMNKSIRGLYSAIMGLIYMKKYTAAFTMLHDFKELGYPKALYTLGCMYEFGLGTEVSKKHALEYYNLAKCGNATYPPFTDEGAKYKSQILRLIKRAEV